VARLVDSDRLIEPNLDGCPAREVNTEVGHTATDLDHGKKPQKDKDGGEDKRQSPLAEKVNVRLANDFNHSAFPPQAGFEQAGHLASEAVRFQGPIAVPSYTAG
jgi:hypothetical protein